MLSLLKILLPALTPSWRFFDSVGPSPRIECLHDQEWREFGARPAVLTWPAMLRRLIWNPDRNESLYLTSCAERLLENPTQHSLDEIQARVGRRWRIVLVSRLMREVAYTSE